MKTVRDLGRIIKAQYPEYSDMSDEEVGRNVKEAYPGKYDDYVEESLDLYESDLPVQAETPTNIQALLDYYRPSRGRFTSWWQRGKAESRNRLLEVLNAEQRLVVERGAILEDAIRNRKKTEAEFRVFIAQNAYQLLQVQHQAVLIENAMAAGLSVEADQAVKTAELLTDIEIDKTRRLSSIKVDEHKQLNSVDLEIELEKMRESVRLAIIAKHLSEHQKISLVNEQLDTLYRQIDEIERISSEKLSDKAKQRMIDDREEIIQTLKEDRRARQKGLLEAHNGRDLRGNDTATEDGGHASPSVEGDSE